MATKRRPAFSPERAAPSGATGWVYRTDISAAVAVTEPSQAPARSHAHRARAIVRNYAGLAAASGLIPFPLVDVAVLSGVQLKMIDALAAHYGVPFEKESGAALFASVAGGLVSTKSGRRIGRSLLKAIPG